MRYSVLIIFFLMIYLLPSSISDEIQDKIQDDIKKYLEHVTTTYSPENREKDFRSYIPSNPNDGSSINIDYPRDENLPVSISRNVLKPKKDGNFYKDETIEISVMITSLKDYGLKQIEFWEMPDDDLTITQCSYPIRTSNISKLLEYERRNGSFLGKNDIVNITGIVLLFKDNQLNTTARQNLNNYLYKQLSNDSMSLINKSDDIKTNGTLQEWLKANLTNDFNKIINNSSTDLLEYFVSCRISIDRARVSSLNPASSDYHNLCDYRLQKRLMLEHIYPKMLNNISFLKKHEQSTLIMDNNAIKIAEKNLHKGETIIFKYCLCPTDLGLKEVRYILRADGYLQQGVATFSISERGEKFSIDYWCNSKDIIKGGKNDFIYSIEYVGGNNERYTFPIIITPPNKCEITDVSWMNESKSEKFKNDSSTGIWFADSVPFSKGTTKKLNVTAKYNDTGLRVSPPTIKVGNYTGLFESDLSVYSSYDNPFIIHYQFLTIILTIAAVFISLIIAIFSSFELYLANKEMKLIREEIKITNKQLNLANSEKIEALKLKEIEIKNLEKLSRIINKILGD